MVRLVVLEQGHVERVEGVETSGQLAALRREGCSEVQGYLFGKPMPAAAFADRYGIRAGGRSQQAQELAAASAEDWRSLDLDAQERWYRRAKDGA